MSFISVLPVLVSLLVTIQGQQQQSSQVIITVTPIASENNPQPAKFIDWQVPTAKKVYYCVGPMGTTALRFSCLDCNSTTVNDRISAATKTLYDVFKFPIVRIADFTVDKLMNGKKLQCDGMINEQETSTWALMSVQYLDKPVIVNKDGEAAAKTASGENRFYLTKGSSMLLQCNGTGNPPPSSNAYTWKADGKVLSKGKTYQVKQTEIGSSVICGVDNGLYPSNLDSDAVKIALWDMPKVYGTDFISLKQNQAGKFDNGKVKLTETISLTCQVTGNPQPFIRWMQMPTGNNMNNAPRSAVCRNNPTSQVLKLPGQPFPNNNRPNQPATNPRVDPTTYLIQSTCDLEVRNYSFAGQYWCSACNSISATSTHCNPSETSVPSSTDLSFKVDLRGQPMLANDKPTAMQNGENDPAQIFVYYCASPAPQPPREIYWQIGDQRVNIGDNGKYRPQPPQQNGTYCFTERLVIDPFTTEDESKQYILRISNAYSPSPLEIQVPVGALLRGGLELTESGHNIGLAVGLALGLFLLLVIIVVAVMWWRGMACFGAKKAPADDRYHSNVAPEHVRSEPPPPTYASNPVTNGYNTSSEKPDGFYGSIRPQDREGMGFAEMDLTPNTRPPLPPPTDYRDYHPAQHSAYPVKSATNSIV